MSRSAHASSEEGFSHWYWQRITGLALVFLVVWFAFFLVCLAGDYHGVGDVVSKLGTPFNSSMMILFIVVSAMHASLGMQIVIQDYITTPALRQGLMVAQLFFCILLATLGIVSVLKIAAATSPLLIGAL